MAYVEDVVSITSTQFQQPFTEAAIGFLPGRLQFTVEDQNVRYWYGGRTPTPTEGHILFIGSSPVFLTTADIINMRIIAVTGTATLTYTVKGV